MSNGWLALLVALTLTPLPAAAQTPAPGEHWIERTTKPGQRVLVWHEFNCSGRLSDVEIITNPLHGKVEFVEESIDLDTTWRGRCGEDAVRGHDIYYTPSLGYVGQDQFVVGAWKFSSSYVTARDAHERHYYFRVTVTSQ